MLLDPNYFLNKAKIFQEKSQEISQNNNNYNPMILDNNSYWVYYYPDNSGRFILIFQGNLL